MKRSVLVLAAFLFAGSLAAQSMTELFQKAKEQVKSESWQDALKTLDALDTESAKPGNEATRAQLLGPLAFYRGVCNANLDKADDARDSFEAFLQTKPNATLDPAVYSKKAVAAFESAQAITATAKAGDGSGPSLFTRYQEFKPPANIAEPVTERWGDGPVKWLFTADEKKAWPRMASGPERDEFIEKFWEGRNPRPGTPDNTFRTGFERRVAFADAYFVQDEEKRGSLTDRGMVFVLLGPPTYGGRRPIRSGEDASESAGMSTVGSHDASNAQRAMGQTGKVTSGSRAVASAGFSGPGTKAPEHTQSWREVWHYRKELLPKTVPYQLVDIEFVTRTGYGVNVLQREPHTLNALDAAKKVAPTTP